MKTIYVDGMMCMHCVKHVTDALMKIDGVIKVDIDLATKKVDITHGKEIDDAKINEAIVQAGYSVIK